MRLTDRVALITAAASGIGRATAEIMAREGAIVAAVDIDEGRLDDTVAALRAAGGRAYGRRADVLDAAEVDRLVSSVAREFGAIDILVNAVGGSTIIAHPGAAMDQLSLEDWRRLLAFNLDGTFLCCHAVAPIMKRQRRGKIVNQSSTAAYITNMGFADTSDPDRPSPPFHYSLAKLGVSGLTKFFAGALGPWGINVNAICPGVTMTEATKSVVPPEILKAIVGATALKKALEPEDLTGTAVFLASEDSDLMTGQVLVVDGGMIMLG
jgi:NAD(P)-dependent dehydrogenase (short-subunit alcohol dehydrogenase family)